MYHSSPLPLRKRKNAKGTGAVPLLSLRRKREKVNPPPRKRGHHLLTFVHDAKKKKKIAAPTSSFAEGKKKKKTHPKKPPPPRKKRKRTREPAALVERIVPAEKKRRGEEKEGNRPSQEGPPRAARFCSAWKKKGSVSELHHRKKRGGVPRYGERRAEHQMPRSRKREGGAFPFYHRAHQKVVRRGKTSPTVSSSRPSPRKEAQTAGVTSSAAKKGKRRVLRGKGKDMPGFSYRENKRLPFSPSPGWGKKEGGGGKEDRKKPWKGEHGARVRVHLWRLGREGKRVTFFFLPRAEGEGKEEGRGLKTPCHRRENQSRAPCSFSVKKITKTSERPPPLTSLEIESRSERRVAGSTTFFFAHRSMKKRKKKGDLHRFSPTARKKKGREKKGAISKKKRREGRETPSFSWSTSLTSKKGAFRERKGGEEKKGPPGRKEGKTAAGAAHSRGAAEKGRGGAARFSYLPVSGTCPEREEERGEGGRARSAWE